MSYHKRTWKDGNLGIHAYPSTEFTALAYRRSDQQFNLTTSQRFSLDCSLTKHMADGDVEGNAVVALRALCGRSADERHGETIISATRGCTEKDNKMGRATGLIMGRHRESSQCEANRSRNNYYLRECLFHFFDLSLSTSIAALRCIKCI